MHIPHEKPLLDFIRLIYSWIQYELSLGFECHYIHRSESCSHELSTRFSEDALQLRLPRLSASQLLELRWQPAGVFFHLLLVCPPCKGFVVRTSSGQRVDSSHADAFLGEVSGESGVMNLLHVLLDFSFGVLQQVCLTLKQEMETMEAPQNDQNSFIFFALSHP